MPQLSTSGRVVTIFIVSGGYIYYALPGSTTWTLTTNLTGESPPLNASGLVQSAANIQKMWYLDGTNMVYADPSTNSVYPWAATAGTLPQDSDGNVGRLIQTWRGRTLVSGLFNEPQNIFFSAVGDPTNWDYAPANPTPTQAVALNLSNLGLIGDSVTSLCAYTDDVLVVFGDHSINLIRGDPMDGGRRDLVTDTIGAVWGNSWCRDPYGTVYFFSNKMGVYTLVPGQKPVRISQSIDNLLSRVNTGTNGITMVWDDAHQGCHLFITPLDAAVATTHYWFDWRSQAWWQVKFGNNDHNPLCTCILDGNLPEDRVVLIGSWDGYVRSMSLDEDTDDGEAIEAEVVIGPILTALFDEVFWDSQQAVLGTGSGDVTWELYSAATPELALAALTARTSPVTSGTWSGSNGTDGEYGGRNPTDLVRSAAHAHYLRVFGSNQFAFESLRVKVGPRGEVRRKGL